MLIQAAITGCHCAAAAAAATRRHCLAIAQVGCSTCRPLAAGAPPCCRSLDLHGALERCSTRCAARRRCGSRCALH